MDAPNKKVNPKETPRDEKIELTDDDVEKAAGGLQNPKKRLGEEQLRY